MLDCVPNATVSSREFIEACNGTDREVLVYRLVLNSLFLEWLSSMMTFCIRPGHRFDGSTAILTNKDVLRRLFAFYQSSLLEVSRFLSSSKWIAKNIAQSRAHCSRQHMYHFENDEANYDPSSKDARSPRAYRLRITNKSGALIREGANIEGSRVVVLAPVGTELLAYERKYIKGKIIRYRTALGWLSECRRDHKREPIVELLEVIYDDDRLLAGINELNPFDKNSEECYDLVMMTARETASYAFERVHLALKQVAVNLARSIIFDRPRSAAISDSASVIAVCLSKILNGFLSHPLTSLQGERPEESPKSAQPGDIAAEVSGVKFSEHATAKISEKKLQAKAKKLKDKQNEKRIASSKANDVTDSSETNESMAIDFATYSLYHGFIIRLIFIPLVKDRNNHFNTYLMQSLQKIGVYDLLLGSFSFILSVLKSEIAEASKSMSAQERVLGSSGRCALHSIPTYIELFSQMIDIESIMRAPITSQMTQAPNNDFVLHEFMYNSLFSIGESLLKVRL